MPVPKGVALGYRALRSVVGENSRIERFLKRRYLGRTRGAVKTDSGPGWTQRAGQGFCIVGDSDQFEEPRRGVALRGGCDLPSVFTAVPLLREGIRGTIAVSRERTGGTGAHATSQVVQTLTNIPPETTAELRSRLKITNAQFEPTFFAEPLEYPLVGKYGLFPKKVVVMSAATDVVRTLYRHRKHRYVVDPGGWWLNQDLGEVLGDLSNVEWFRGEFEKVGRISVDDFIRNVETIVRELRDRAGAELVMYSALVVDPSDPTHNYQLVRQASVTRRREFHVALMELSKRLNFHIVDVDRVLKREGVEDQVDFAHFTADGMRPIGAEFHRILRELEIA